MTEDSATTGLVARGKQSLARTGTALAGMVALILLCWLIEAFDFVWPMNLDQLGIIPRSVSGLFGILLAPFLHGSFGHLLANTIAILGLGTAVALGGPVRFLSVSVIAGLVSGSAVWLLGSSSTVTVGASGVIYGYLGYLLLAGWYRRSLLAFGGSLVIAVLFGGLLWGMFPFFVGANVSWLGHFSGFVGGILAARLLAPQDARS